MARATWSGQISFGLVNVPVKLYTAVRSHDVRFHQLHETTGARVRRKRVDAKTGEEVPTDEIVKGWEVDGGRYVVVDPDELEQLDPEATRTVDIQDFVELAEIEPIYYERPYYLAPDGEGARKPYALLVEAMDRTGKAAIARFVMRTKEHLAAIRARDGVLLLNTMHHADEVVDPVDIDADTEDVEVTDRELEMAEQLIGSLTTGFEPEAYRDQHHERVMEFLRAKAEGEDVTVEAAADEEAEVIDLMDALEASLGRTSSDGQERSYDDMTKAELYELAQDADVPGRSDMTKDELIAALEDERELAAS